MKENSLLRRIFPKLWRRRQEGGSEQDAPTGTDPDAETIRPRNTPNLTIPNIDVVAADSGPVATSSDSISIQNGPNLGLRVLYEPPADLPVAVDVIFVHGLTGNAYNTWRSDGKGKLKIHWPSDLLKADIPDARILSFGYDADVVGWFSPVSNNRVGNHAENLLGAVTRLQAKTKSESRSIIFVMHSLGGLVVQNALDLSRSSPEDHLTKLESNTIGLLFMGTPNFGSDKALWGSFAAAMVGIVRKTNKPIVHVLKPDSEMLASIQKKFHEVLRLRQRQGLAIHITCFYEELDMIAVGTIVEKKSAIIPGYSSYGIHADHRGMTKFEDTKDKGYEDVLGELLRWTKEAREVQVQRTDHQECLDAIYFDGLESRKEVAPEPLPGTFSWVWDATQCDFVQWLEMGRGLYWIRGKACSGKSTLVKYIVDTSMDNAQRLFGDSNVPIIVPYFIEDKSQYPLASTLEGIMRALLWKLLRRVPRLLSVVLPLYHDMKRSQFVSHWKLSDLQDMLTKSLAQHHPRPLWIFLDGLDEYQGDLLDITDLCNKAVEISSTTVRICVSSRPEREIDCSIGPSANILNSVLGLEEHTQQDIIALAEKEIERLSSLMDSEKRSEIVEHLRTRAHGLFIWVKLASRDLVRSWINGVVVTSEDLIKRLDILPEEINELYLQMLQRRMKYSTNDDGLCMLGVATFGRRSFNIREGFFIMTGRTIQKDEEQDALLRKIDACTGGLLEHRQGRIVFAHNTVQAFVRNLAKRESYMNQLMEAHKKLADACLLLLQSFESLDSKNASSQPLSKSDGLILKDLTRYSTHYWLYHYKSATDHSQRIKAPSLHRISNEQILHWQKIYLARCWEQPLLMADDCHPARSALAFVLMSVTRHDIFSSQPALPAEIDLNSNAFPAFGELWKHHESDMDFLITIEFAPGYLVYYHTRRILEGKMAHIDCRVATPQESSDTKLVDGCQRWIDRFGKSSHCVRTFQNPATLRRCLPAEFMKLPGESKGIHVRQVIVEQIKTIIWCCIRLELDKLESPKSGQNNSDRLRLATPLHFAAFNGLEDVVVSLEMHGADLTYSLIDSPYSTPLIAGIWGLNEQRHIRSRNDNTIATLLHLDKTRKTLEVRGNSGYLGVTTPLNTAVKLYTGFMKDAGMGPYELRGVIEMLVGDGAHIDPATRAIARTSYELRRYFADILITEFSSYVSQFSSSAPIPIPNPRTRPQAGPNNFTVGGFGRAPLPSYPRIIQTYNHDNHWA